MASKQMDPDRFQMRDVKRRLSQVERDLARLERRHAKLHEDTVEFMIDARSARNRDCPEE